MLAEGAGPVFGWASTVRTSPGAALVALAGAQGPWLMETAGAATLAVCLGRWVCFGFF